MKTIPNQILLLLTAVIIFSCDFSNNGVVEIIEHPTIKQGVYGVVKFWEGNFMPSPNTPQRDGIPVPREVFIYELTSRDMAVKVNYTSFFRQINAKLIASKFSNEKGFFEFELPEGKYSMFVKEDSLYYANGWDGEGNIYPFTVKKDSLTSIQFDITYKASF